MERSRIQESISINNYNRKNAKSFWDHVGVAARRRQESLEKYGFGKKDKTTNCTSQVLGNTVQTSCR